MNPREPKRRATAPSRSGLQGDKGEPKQDTPGRPKSSSSRQQTQPGQNSQTGSPELDARSARKH
jgi:hypothetical protein